MPLTHLMAPGEGTIEISEDSLPLGDWRLKSILCSELGEGIVFSYDADTDEATSTAEFDVGEGGTFNCTFDNEFFGAPVLSVIKKVLPTTGTCDAAVRDSCTASGLRLRFRPGEQLVATILR